MTALTLARTLALLVPATLLAAAYGSQYWGGLFPCEMCWWQRYAHFAALIFALLAFAFGVPADRARAFIRLAALAVFVSGAIGAYHAGVELGIFEGVTQCAVSGARVSAAEMLDNILKAPMVRCDQVQWSFLGVSMAGWNAIVSIASAALILWLSLKARRPWR